jgi:hypothetical protein
MPNVSFLLRLVIVATATLSLGMAACGGAAQPAGSPAPPPSPSPPPQKSVAEQRLEYLQRTYTTEGSRFKFRRAEGVDIVPADVLRDYDCVDCSQDMRDKVKGWIEAASRAGTASLEGNAPAWGPMIDLLQSSVIDSANSLGQLSKRQLVVGVLPTTCLAAETHSLEVDDEALITVHDGVFSISYALSKIVLQATAVERGQCVEIGADYAAAKIAADPELTMVGNLAKLAGAQHGGYGAYSPRGILLSDRLMLGVESLTLALERVILAPEYAHVLLGHDTKQHDETRLPGMVAVRAAKARLSRDDEFAADALAYQIVSKARELRRSSCTEGSSLRECLLTLAPPQQGCHLQDVDLWAADLLFSWFELGEKTYRTFTGVDFAPPPTHPPARERRERIRKLMAPSGLTKPGKDVGEAFAGALNALWAKAAPGLAHFDPTAQAFTRRVGCYPVNGRTR